MIEMNLETIDAINRHAMSEFGDGSSPKECCGLVVIRKGREIYVPCRNVSSDPTEQFRIHPEDYASAEDSGEVVCVVHSHPYLPADPSDADRIMCEESGLPWFIMSVPSGDHVTVMPSGYVQPLIGRKFVHGIMDCYSLIRDYYRTELSIQLPDFHRDVEWWNKNQNLYMDNFEVAGFAAVPGGLVDMSLHDVLLMQVNSPVVNHAGVYIGNNVVMHHFMNRLSSRDVLGESLRRTVIKVVRHERFM